MSLPTKEEYLFRKFFPIIERRNGSYSRNTIPKDISCGRLFIHRTGKNNKFIEGNIHIYFQDFIRWKVEKYLYRYIGKQIKIYCKDRVEKGVIYGTLYSGIVTNIEDNHLIIKNYSEDYKYTTSYY